MPLPKPNPNEKQKEYIARCMKDSTMQKEFPDIKQRNAVCFSNWRRSKQATYKLPFEK